MSNSDPLAPLRCTCLRCIDPETGRPYTWVKRIATEPVKCPHCKSRLWNTPRRRKGRRMRPAAAVA